MRQMLILKILAVVLLLAGFGTVLEAKTLVRKFKMDQNAKANFEHEMSDEELAQYKLTKATVNVKMIGMLIALPGIILTLLTFK